MLYLIYDSAKYGSHNLMLLKDAFNTNAMLLSSRYDGDLEFVAPWIFAYNTEQSSVLKDSSIKAQNLCWVETEATLQDIIHIYQKIIYDGDIAHARSFYRCWDIKVIREEFNKIDSNIAKNLLKVVENIYLPVADKFCHYRIDNWGKIIKSEITKIPAMDTSCHSLQQD